MLLLNTDSAVVPLSLGYWHYRNLMDWLIDWYTAKCCISLPIIYHARAPQALEGGVLVLITLFFILNLKFISSHTGTILTGHWVAWLEGGALENLCGYFYISDAWYKWPGFLPALYAKILRQHGYCWHNPPHLCHHVLNCAMNQQTPSNSKLLQLCEQDDNCLQ